MKPSRAYRPNCFTLSIHLKQLLSAANIALYCSFFTLNGCGSGLNEESTPPYNEDNTRALLADVVTDDAGLKACLDTYKTVYVDELMHLKCLSMTNGNGLEQLTALETISLSFGYHPIETLNLTSLTKLKEIGLDGTNISHFEFSSQPQLELIHFYDVPLTSLDISNNFNLKSISLFVNNMSEIDLSNNSKLETLHLYDTKLSQIDLSNNLHLKDMDLAANNISEIDLSNNARLTHLSIRGTKIQKIDLSQLSILERLYISSSSISNLDLSGNPLLQSLDISKTKISCEEIGEIIATNSNIISLEIPHLCGSLM